MLLNALNPRRRWLPWACAAMILAAIGLSGCEKCNLMGNNFGDNSLADEVRRVPQNRRRRQRKVRGEQQVPAN